MDMPKLVIIFYITYPKVDAPGIAMIEKSLRSVRRSTIKKDLGVDSELHLRIHALFCL